MANLSDGPVSATIHILGDRIREARRGIPMTQGELAGTDFCVSYISAVERNKIKPSLRALALLASKLAIPVSDLLVGASDDFDAADATVPANEQEVQSALAQAQTELANNQPREARDRLLGMPASIPQPSLRTLANLLLGEAYIALGQANDAKDILERNVHLTKDVDPVMQEQSRNLLGVAYNRLAMHMLAAECHRQCQEFVKGGFTHDPTFQLSVLYNLGNDYLLLGQFDEAILIFEEAARLGQQLQTPQDAARLYYVVSQKYRDDGKNVMSQRYADLAAEYLRMAANRQVFAHLQSSLGQAYVEMSRTDDAERTLEQARAIAERNDDAQSRSMALASLTRVRLARGAKREALEAAEQAFESAQITQDRDTLGRAHLALGEALAATAREADADRHFAEGLLLLEANGSAAEKARAYERYAELLEQRGDVKKALEYLKKSRAVAAR